jgi:hypothetical protein
MLVVFIITDHEMVLTKMTHVHPNMYSLLQYVRQAHGYCTVVYQKICFHILVLWVWTFHDDECHTHNLDIGFV